MSLKLYWFKDKRTGKKRRTPVVASSAAAAKKRLKRPSAKNAVVEYSRSPTASERKTISKGKWVKGNRNRGKSVKGYNKLLGRKRK